MRCYQCLCFTLVIGCVIFQDVSGVARVKRSASDNLRDPGTYIVHFKDSTTDAQLQHFIKQLSYNKGKFGAKIVAEYLNIKCLTAKLSKGALKWVRILFITFSKVHMHLYRTIINSLNILASNLLSVYNIAGYPPQIGTESEEK